MKEYYELPPLLDQEIVERASKFGTAELCDGMKGLGILNDGCMEASMMPIDENTKIVGTACTVETQDGDNFPIHVAIYQSKPGYILVVDGKGYTKAAYIGDLMGGASKAIGLNGIVIDGMVRDKIGLREMKMPVYAKGFMQKGPSKVGPGKLNSPIMCAGVNVNPGDLVVGDADGVTVVPRERIEEVLDLAEKKMNYEVKRRKAISNYVECREKDEELPNLAPDWVLEMLNK